jgi:hypothetical protein
MPPAEPCEENREKETEIEKERERWWWGGNRAI